MKKNSRNPGIFSRLSLKNLIQTALLSAVFILLTVTTLAVREWYTHVHCSKLLEESRLIRAHSGEFSQYIIELLLTDQIINMEEVGHEASIIGRKGAHLAGRPLIPEEFKLLLVSRNDMTKLMARIRLLSATADKSEKQLIIYRMLRDIDNRIAKFDEGYSRYVQQQWQTIQNLLRGFLAIATVFLTMVLFLLHIHVIRPFFELTNELRGALGKKDIHHQTVESIHAIAHLGRQVRAELAACTLYKNSFHIPPGLESAADTQNLLPGGVWRMVAPLLQQHPHYKRVSTSFLHKDRKDKELPDYFLEEIQNRGVVIFRNTEDLSFSRIRKILDYPGEIRTGICFSVDSASKVSGIVTVLSDDSESFTEQEVNALNTFLRFFEYIDSHSSTESNSKIGFSLEELRAMSLSLLNELPPHRGCHSIMNHTNGIINCAQIIRDQETSLGLQEKERQNLMTDLWESGKKIAAAVNRLRTLQQLYSDPVTSVENAITLLTVWLELQFPEVSHILEKTAVAPLPPVQIPGRDLFLAMALQAEQVIPDPGRDYSSCLYTQLQITADIQSQTEVIIEMILRPKPGEVSGSDENTATHLRRLLGNGLLHCFKSDLEVFRTEDQTLTYRFVLR